MVQFYNNSPVLFLESKDIAANGAPRIDTMRPIVVAIMSTSCPHCINAEPAFGDFAKSERDRILCATVMSNGSADEQRAASLLGGSIPGGIMGVPMFVLYRNGVYVKTHQGGRSKADFVQFANTA